jgi:transposase
VGANPVDRGKPGSKLHLICDASGLPLTAVVTAANVNGTTMFQAVVDDVPPVRTPSGRRRTRPGKLHADKGYDSRANRAYLRRRGIRPRIARRGVESSARLGRHRWKVERSLSWLSCFRRLQVRWDRDAGRWFAFVLVACAVVCFNRVLVSQGRGRTYNSACRNGASHSASRRVRRRKWSGPECLSPLWSERLLLGRVSAGDQDLVHPENQDDR